MSARRMGRPRLELDVPALRAFRALGASWGALAGAAGVSRSTVRRAVLGQGPTLVSGEAGSLFQNSPEGGGEGPAGAPAAGGGG